MFPSKKEKAHYHYDIRFLLISNSDNYIVSNESKELRWIDKDIKNLPSDNPAVLRMFNKWIKLN